MNLPVDRCLKRGAGRLAQQCHRLSESHDMIVTELDLVTQVAAEDLDGAEPRQVRVISDAL
jgi:hypothetical protein